MTVERPERARFAFVTLMSLSTFVVAQSIYDILLANPELITVRRIGHGQLLAVIAAFNVLVPLSLCALWAVLDRG